MSATLAPTAPTEFFTSGNAKGLQALRNRLAGKEAFGFDPIGIEALRFQIRRLEAILAAVPTASAATPIKLFVEEDDEAIDTTLEAFVADNGLSEADAAVIRREVILGRGVFIGGGGAAPAYAIHRAA